MKKILLSVVCLAVVGIQRVMAQSSVAALHHEGNVTLYSGSKLQTAIAAAVAGDTIYLSEGTFPGITVNKGAVIVGTGEKTIIGGDVRIETYDIGSDNCILDGLFIAGDISLRYDINGLLISQCQFNNLDYIDNGATRDITIVRSYCKQILELQHETSLSVVACKIGEIRDTSAAGEHNFHHCNIGNFSVNGSSATFVNCILGTTDNSGASYIKCLMKNTNIFTSNLENCWNISDGDLLDNNLNCIYSDFANCIGTDGTVVGITGGDVPYTLTPSAPHVSAHKIEVDAAAQKLNLTLTITNE